MRYDNVTISEAIMKQINENTPLECKMNNFGQSRDPRGFNSDYVGSGKFTITINEEKLHKMLEWIIGDDARLTLTGESIEIDFVQMDTEKRNKNIGVK